jgi:NADPH:quinone reductase
MPNPSHAVTVSAFGVPPTIEVRTIDEPEAGPDEIVLDLVAADVVPLDRQIAQGFFPPANTLPLSVGVSAVARRRDTGDLVSVQGGHIGMGITRAGCFASSFVAPTNVLAPLPAGLNPIVAAAGSATAITAILALRDHAALCEGERVLVLGASGGVGRACMQLATHLGAVVTGAARDPLSVEAPMGTTMVGYEQIIGLDVDVIVDPVGGQLFQTAILAGRHRCRHVFLGFAGGATVDLKLPLMMIAEHRVLGFNEHATGHDRLMEVTAEAMRYLAAGILVPMLGGTYPLADAATAYGAVGSGLGRILLVP